MLLDNRILAATSQPLEALFCQHVCDVKVKSDSIEPARHQLM